MIVIDATNLSQSSIQTALSISSLFNKSIKLQNIKLNSQILEIIMVLKQATNAYVEGAILNSNEVIFQPTKNFNIKKLNIETNYSYYPFIQSILIPQLFSNSISTTSLKYNYDSNSPPIDYLKEVLLKYLNKYITNSSIKIITSHFDNQNKSEVVVSIQGKFSLDEELPKLNINYHKNLIAIKTNINLTQDFIQQKIMQKIIDLLKLSFSSSKLTSTINTNVIQSSSGISINSFALYGEQNYDNYSPYIKQIYINPEINTFKENYQKIILDYVNQIKQIIIKDGLDEQTTINLLPLIAITKGEIITTQITQEIKDNIFVLEKLLDIEFKINKNQISCNDIVSINDL
ncbi:MAG: RNA 3'-terminal phosphate cyclase [Candidatus Woesearchaeota archaeon]